MAKRKLVIEVDLQDEHAVPMRLNPARIAGLLWTFEETPGESGVTAYLATVIDHKGQILRESE